MMSEWEIDDSLFGVSRSAEKVTVNIRNYVWMAAEFRVQGWKNLLSRGGREASVEEEREIAEKLIERMLKEDEFTNQKVPFFGPV